MNSNETADVEGGKDNLVFRSDTCDFYRWPRICRSAWLQLLGALLRARSLLTLPSPQSSAKSRSQRGTGPTVFGGISSKCQFVSMEWVPSSAKESVADPEETAKKKIKAWINSMSFFCCNQFLWIGCYNIYEYSFVHFVFCCLSPPASRSVVLCCLDLCGLFGFPGLFLHHSKRRDV